jgi:hypothetical protein
LHYATRNHALGFAERSRKNLAFIEHARSQGSDVHVVTQLVVSMLGLVVFPMERNLVARLETLTLRELKKRGWPEWRIELGDCDTMEELTRHLRNAVAHGRITFDTDDRALEQVSIQVEDYRLRATNPYWRASIGAADLRKFCLSLVDLIEQTIG